MLSDAQQSNHWISQTSLTFEDWIGYYHSKADIRKQPQESLLLFRIRFFHLNILKPQSRREPQGAPCSDVTDVPVPNSAVISKREPCLEMIASSFVRLLVVKSQRLNKHHASGHATFLPSWVKIWDEPDLILTRSFIMTIVSTHQRLFARYRQITL